MQIDALLAKKAQLALEAAAEKAQMSVESFTDYTADEIEDAVEGYSAAELEYALPQGYFTVEFGELYDGEETHRTFRVKDASSQSKLSGKRIISLLVGSNNMGDYMGVGFVTADGVSLWKRFGDDTVLADAIRILNDDPHAAQMGYAMSSGNCYVCGRLLTEPESIKMGIGPVCREG